MTCFECDNAAEHMHHVVPKSLGGTKMVPLCAICHGLVHDRKMVSSGALTKKALAHKRARGEVYAPTPFGFDAIDGKLIESHLETIVVKEIIKKRRAGASYGAIAELLNQCGIRGKQGGAWYAATVRYLINRQEQSV